MGGGKSGLYKNTKGAINAEYLMSRLEKMKKQKPKVVAVVAQNDAENADTKSDIPPAMLLAEKLIPYKPSKQIIKETKEAKNKAIWKKPINDEPGQLATFDGKQLRIYEDGKLIKVFDAEAGRVGTQTKEYQFEKNKGPLPEGTYVARIENRQDIKDISKIERAASFVGMGPWPGGTRSWGSKRVWLDPSKANDMRERDGFTVHGGSSAGSAGCIDLGSGMDTFDDWLKINGKDLVIKVRYTDE